MCQSQGRNLRETGSTRSGSAHRASPGPTSPQRAQQRGSPRGWRGWAAQPGGFSRRLWLEWVRKKQTAEGTGAAGAPGWGVLAEERRWSVSSGKSAVNVGPAPGPCLAEHRVPGPGVPGVLHPGLGSRGVGALAAGDGTLACPGLGTCALGATLSRREHAAWKFTCVLSPHPGSRWGPRLPTCLVPAPPASLGFWGEREWESPCYPKCEAVLAAAEPLLKRTGSWGQQPLEGRTESLPGRRGRWH